MEIGTGIVTGRQIAKNKDGNKSVRLLQVMITDEKDVQTIQLVSQTGEESNPPSSSMVVFLGAGEAFKLAIATADGILPDLAVGGKRIYSTDAPGDVVMAEVRLDPDGKITIHNGAVSHTLFPDGTAILDNGAVKQTLLPDGTGKLENDAASVTMTPAGQFNFHGVLSTFDHPIVARGISSLAGGAGGGTGTIQAAGDISTPADVTAGSISLQEHIHSVAEHGTTGGPVS